MSEADKMFEESGYKRIKQQDSDEVFRVKNEWDGKIIWFDKLRKEFGSLSGIGVKELKAIIKKIEEFGWLKESE